MRNLKIILSLSLLAQLTVGQIRFGGSSSGSGGGGGGGRPSFPSRPSRPSGRPSQSVEFGNNNNNNNNNNVGVSGVKSLADILGKSSSEVTGLTRRVNANSRRRGATCTTPLGQAGTCQYIFASQCSSILQIILQQGVNPQVLAYLFQV